jgi:hypothetical protein
MSKKTANDTPELLMRQMTREHLQSHHRWLKMRRRRAVSYGINGSVVYIKRREAVDLAARLLGAR